MGLHGKLMAAIQFKKGGDVFHELFAKTPHKISNVAPGQVQGCDLHEGEFGKVGSVLFWKYTHDGKELTAKDLIQAIDHEKKSIELKVLEGDVLKEYKDFVLKVHVETKGEIDLVTWTVEYETLTDEVGHPLSYLDFFIQLTKEIEANHHKNP